MKTCCCYLTLLFIVLAGNGCSNDVEVLAGYEENAAIYGILDPNQAVQLIKINKVFTNPNNSAANVAKISDSLYFDTIQPILREIETNRVIPLYRANIILKDSGYFANSPNYLYATKEKIYARNPKNTSQYLNYRLELTLPKTGKKITAVTNIPDSILVSSPLTVRSQITPAIDFKAGNTFKVIFPAPAQAKLCDAYFNFNYLEINKQDTNQKTVKTARWRLVNNYRTIDDIGGENVVVTIASNAFFDFLLTSIPVDANVNRKFMRCEMLLTAGNLELDNYIQAAEPSIGIVQKQTDYTNIKVGVGIFAGRRLTHYNNLELGFSAQGTIMNEPAYKVLGFVK